MMVIEIIVAFLVVAGAFFSFLGSFALVKLPGFFTRLHGPTKAGTLGVGLILLASAIFFSFHNNALSVQEILISMFMVITAPITGHMLGKTALHKKTPLFLKTYHFPEKRKKPR